MSAMKEWIRRWLMRWVSLSFRLGTTPGTPDNRALILIAPHPDDDILGCGGLIAAKVSRGARVRVIFLTDGAASHPGHPNLPAAELVPQRKREALAALNALGVLPDQITFLDLPDGRLDRLAEAETLETGRRLREIVQNTAPARVFVPLADEGSSEHRAANHLSTSAFPPNTVEFIEYAVWAWWDPRRLLPRLWQKPRPLRLELGPLRHLKKAALAQHVSQTQAIPPWKFSTLPGSLSEACCGPRELYFPRQSSHHVL